jgi:hypothetical protein
MVGVCSMHGVMRSALKFWSEKLNRRYYLEDLDVGGKIILERILGK